MVIERNTEWQHYRKKLILEIKDAGKQIEAVFGNLKGRVNGKLQSAHFSPNNLKPFFSEISNEYTKAAGQATKISVSLVDTASNLAHQAGSSTDKAVFGANMKFSLGNGAPEVAKHLKSKRYKSGFKLSEKIWPSDKKLLRKFHEAVETGIAQGRILGKTVERMVWLKDRYGEEKIPKYLKEIETAAKKATINLPGAKEQYRKLVNNVKKQLAKRKVGEFVRPVGQGLAGLGTRRAGEAFLARVDNAINKNSLLLIEEATEKYLEKRATYHSVRAARTMAGRAFKQTGQAERKKKDWVIGEKWNLSSSHPRYDECDLRVMVDFGLGPGIYPKGAAPDDHVNGLCFLTDVIDEKYFEREQPYKPKYKKNTRKLIKEVEPGSPLSKYANRLGRLQNEGRIADELANVGPHFHPDLLPANPANVTQLTFDQVAYLVKEKYGILEKQAAEIAQSKIAKIKPKKVSRNIPTYLVQREQAKLAEQTHDALLAKKLYLEELEQKAKRAVAEYAEEKEMQRHFSGMLKDLQAKRVLQKESTIKAIEEELAEARKKIEELKKAQAAIHGEKEIPTRLFDEFEQIGAQAGSNPGGFYRDKATGEKFYIKFPGSGEHARNEALAAALYREANIKVPELAMVYDRGNIGVASKIIDGLEQNASLLKSGKVSGLMDGFGMDAWLANWDVVGLNFDNLLVKGTRAYRIDTGGALLYRAQGAQKGAAFGNLVEEWNTFRTVSNYTTTQVFKNITEKQLISAGNKVLRISDKKIRELVKMYGFGDDLANTLIERKRWIANEVKRLKNQAKPLKVAEPNLPKRITAEEFEKIRSSRGNGYAVRIDTDEIEDQQILFWREKGQSGKWSVNAELKVRGSAMDKMEALINLSRKSAPAEEADEVYRLFLENVKGILHRINQGKLDIAGWDSHVFTRFEELRTVFRSLDTAKQQYYKPWFEAVEQIFETKNVVWNGPEGFLTPFTRMPDKTITTRFQFKRKNGVYAKKIIDRGELIRTSEAVEFSGTKSFQYYYEAEVDGVTIRYWPKDDDLAFVNHGRIHLYSTDGKESVDDILDVIDKVGIKSTRPTNLDVEELYLNQIAYTTRPSKYGKFEKIMDNPDQRTRIVKMQKWLSEEFGEDVTKMPDYAPTGRHEFWGDGKVHRMRPDLKGGEWEKFKNDYRLCHTITGDTDKVAAFDAILNSGGKFIPTTDKLRRGLRWGGMSPQADMQSGGANYFFTRIKRRQENYPGIYWRVDPLKRLDAISYPDDKYGRTIGDTVRKRRMSSISDFIRASHSSNNETIFKDGLSVFEHLDKIVTQSGSEKRDIIAVFKKHGYAVFPDGRKIEDIVQ
jgi:hypothetical protein